MKLGKYCSYSLSVPCFLPGCIACGGAANLGLIVPNVDNTRETVIERMKVLGLYEERIEPETLMIQIED